MSEPEWHWVPKPPFTEYLGFEVLEWKNDYAVVTAKVMDEHANTSGLPHGGFIATLLDYTTALCGIYADDPAKMRKTLTLSLNINFLGQASGSRIKAVSRVTAKGKKIFYSAAEVFDEADTLIASAQGVFRYRQGGSAL